MELTKSQSISIRYVQAIGILFVVMGHYPVKLFNLFTPYAFHMPLFFILGGVLYKKRNYASLISRNIKKHGGYIFINYIIIAFIMTVFNEIYSVPVSNLIINNSIFDTISYVLDRNFHNNTFFLVAWFLFAYMIVSIIAPIIFIIKNRVLLFSIIILIGYFSVNTLAIEYQQSKIQSYNLITQVLVGLMYYSIGYLLKDFLLSSKSVAGILVAFFILIALHTNGKIAGMGMAWSSYSMGFWTHLLVSVTCAYIIFNITNIASSISDEVQLFSSIGKYSRSIMSYHLLSFLIIDLAFYYTGVYDIKKSGALNHYSDNRFYVIYISAGIIIPITLGFLSSNALRKIKFR
ncbi:acyltransferase family protein [Providencia alcalifaciens]|uniref:acyltransferase family protein n=1 Tax=Providencia alcalifaciens TaxID=126385 RepID=UPI001CC3E740|nr:acyltransferase family protein [Providencia alcalifaciens]